MHTTFDQVSVPRNLLRQAKVNAELLIRTAIANSDPAMQPHTIDFVRNLKREITEIEDVLDEGCVICHKDVVGEDICKDCKEESKERAYSHA